MRELTHVLGRDINEQIASIDSHLSAIYGRPRKEVTRVQFAAPFCVCLDQTELGKGFFTVAGTIGNLAADVTSCEKDTELILQLTCGDTLTTKRFNVKKGLTKISETLSVEAFTKLSISFSLPIIDGHVGYTFIPTEGA